MFQSENQPLHHVRVPQGFTAKTIRSSSVTSLQRYRRSRNIDQAAVHQFLDRFAGTEPKWPLQEECGEAWLEKRPFVSRQVSRGENL